MPTPCSAEIGSISRIPSRRYSAVCSSMRLGVDLVDREQQRLAAAQEQAGKVIVGCGQRSAPIDHHHDGVGLIERHPGLAKDFRRNQLRVVGKDAAGIHHPSMLARPLDLAVNPVTGDARLIAHDRAA